MTLPLSYSRQFRSSQQLRSSQLVTWRVGNLTNSPVALVGGEGRTRTFEASRATDLQSAAFDRFATSPAVCCLECAAFGTYPRAESPERWSWRRDLNPRPADYKSAALPTELRQPDKSWTIALPVPEAQTPIRSTTSAHSRAAPAHPQPSIVSPGGRPRRRRCLAAGTLPNPFKQNNSGRDRDVEALDMAAHRN